MVSRTEVTVDDIEQIRLSRDLRPGKHRIRIIFIPDGASGYDSSRSRVLVLRVKRAKGGRR